MKPACYHMLTFVAIRFGYVLLRSATFSLVIDYASGHRALASMPKSSLLDLI